jgi:hypothetical protein
MDVALAGPLIEIEDCHETKHEECGWHQHPGSGGIFTREAIRQTLTRFRPPVIFKGCVLRSLNFRTVRYLHPHQTWFGALGCFTDSLYLNAHAAPSCKKILKLF